MRHPVNFSDSPAIVERDPPHPGEHIQELLDETPDDASVDYNVSNI